jgi:hypothetical protein
MSAPSPFAARLAAVAEDQHAKFHLMNEADPLLCGQIRKYHIDLGLQFARCTEVWGGAFVSWCVRQAGATKDEFAFSKTPAVFTHKAIRNAVAGTGVFQGFDVGARPAAVGDIVVFSSGRKAVDFSFASTNRLFMARAAIVVEVSRDSDGHFALVVGGNVGDSIRRTMVRLDAQGIILQRPANPFICLIKALK